MTDTHDLRNQWYDEPVQYEKPMTEIEEVKSKIKLLEQKLAFLEELEKTKSKSPVEEAYKDWWGQYPETGTWDGFDEKRWQGFQAGYEFAYAISTAKEVMEKVQKPKTLWERFYDAKWSDSACDEFCEIVKEWISQYGCDYNDRYAEGYEDALETLKENLK